MKALLLIDIQNDFLPGGALAVANGDEIIPVVNRLVTKFDLVIASQDWHPREHKSFAADHPGKKAFDQIDLNGLNQVLWPAHCVQQTTGAEFSNEVNMSNVEAIFRKGTDSEIDSYSAFYDNGHRKSTALAEYLRGRKITEVFVAGLAADYCVYYTAKDAIAEGFATVIIEDAVKAIDDLSFKEAKKDVLNRGGRFVSSNELP